MTAAGGPPLQQHRLAADAGASGERLDRFLVRALPQVSRKAVKRALDSGRVFVDDRCERRAGFLLAGGETLLISLEAPPPAEPQPAAPPVLYRDEELLAIAKPAGLPAHPTVAGRRNALDLVRELLRAEGQAGEPILLHRLDADTTGVLLFALSDRANRELSRGFAEHRMDKRYLALVAGAPPERLDIANHLRAGVRGRTVAVQSGGQPARTEVLRQRQGPGFALVEAHPQTGRTHQIRVHLAGVGHPLLGDTLYGGPTTLVAGGTVLRADRHLLHAVSLAFPHPATGQPLLLTAPLPADFAPFLQLLPEPGVRQD